MCACVNLCALCACRYPWKPEEGAEHTGTGVAQSCEPQCGCQESNLGSLQEQPVPLTTLCLFGPIPAVLHSLFCTTQASHTFLTINLLLYLYYYLIFYMFLNLRELQFCSFHVLTLRNLKFLSECENCSLFSISIYQGVLHTLRLLMHPGIGSHMFFYNLLFFFFDSLSNWYKNLSCLFSLY